MQAGCAAKYHQIQQRVAAQTVGAVNRHAGRFTAGKQSLNILVFAIGILGNRLTTDVGGNTTHHIVAGRHYRNRLFDRVHMGKGLGQLTECRADAGSASPAPRWSSFSMT